MKRLGIALVTVVLALSVLAGCSARPLPSLDFIFVTPPKLPPPGALITDAATAIAIALKVCKSNPGKVDSLDRDRTVRFQSSLRTPWVANLERKDSSGGQSYDWIVSGGENRGEPYFAHCREFEVVMDAVNGKAGICGECVVQT